MSALERVARRIGMRRGADVWYEQPDKFGCIEDDLQTYLLTGDRPLRVQVEYVMGCLPTENWPGNDESLWYATAYSERVSATLRNYGSSPAAAIIALAERIEGEQK